MNKPVANDSGTVVKALEVLDMVAEIGRPVRFAELLLQSPLPKATLYRFLQTLTNQGMLTYDSERHFYSLGLRLVRLAHAAWRQSSLAPIARPYIDALAQQVGETVHLAQTDNGHVLFIDKRNLSSVFETLALTGQVAPAYCTGVGKVILAFMTQERRKRAFLNLSFMKYTPATHATLETLLVELEEIRQDGVGYDREEHQQGIISIAAPIMSGGHRVIGALSIATSTSRHDLAALNAFRPALLETAAKIGAEAETWQYPTQNQTNKGKPICPV